MTSTPLLDLVERCADCRDATLLYRHGHDLVCGACAYIRDLEMATAYEEEYDELD